ncbi:MAG: DsbA family oxidoreductase [Cyanobacteria bacterium J06649_4]
MKLTVGITSDFICPWCLVAESRLNRAIQQLGSDVEIERVWYPLELNPNMPEVGMDRKAYRTGKFGSWAYSQQLDAKTIEATKHDDVDFRYDLMAFTPHTLKAHRLTWLAGKKGMATEMAVRILRAYFSEGQNISDIETLAALADEVGIGSSEEIKAFLLSPEGTQAVKALEQQASRNGIRSVPTVQIGNQIVSGAQSENALVLALQKAIDERKVTI